MENRHKLLGPNFSTTDWDFIKESDWSPWNDWWLTNWIFISPPNCLRFNTPGVLPNVMFLSNLPQAQNIKAGRLVTWYRRQAYGVGGAFFVIGVTGPGSEGIRTSPWISVTEFLRSRITWWQTLNPSGDLATIVVRDNWIDEQWVHVSTLYHPPLTGEVNRVGIVAKPQFIGGAHFFDDTEIWRQL